MHEGNAGRWDESHQVIIAGGGPVGLFAALVLARQGIPSVLFEADSGVCEGSRAICLSRRSLQILDRARTAAPFLERGLGWHFGETFLGTCKVFDLKMDQSSDDRFPPFINLQQYYAEEFLTAECQQTGIVDIRLNSRVTDVQPQKDCVIVAVERDARTTLVRGEWLIAADGARSAVRTALGLSLEGSSFDSRYLIADVDLDIDWPTRRKVWFDPISNPGSTVIMHRQPDHVWRIDYQLRPEEDSERELQDQRVNERISCHLKMIGIDKPFRLLWKSLYQARSLSLESYIHDRTLFVGDAAHLVPIFGVRGLNSGLDDAMNLGWKLGMVLRHLASPILLDSFNKERRDAYLENIENAVKATWFMSPPTPGFVLVRDAILELATKYEDFRCLVDPRQSTFHRYRSPAILESVRCPLVGLPMPEMQMSDGSSIYSVLGDGFSVVSVSERTGSIMAEDVELGRLTVRRADVPLTLVRSEMASEFTSRALLVRPDGYVAACFGADEPDEIVKALHLLGMQVSEESTHAN